jgi:hypothetical protein
VEASTGTLVGIPVNWALHLLNRYLGEAILEAYDRNVGRHVHAIAEINFTNHLIGRHPSKLAPLKKLVFDFGTSAKLPKMEAGVHE